MNNKILLGILGGYILPMILSIISRIVFITLEKRANEKDISKIELKDLFEYKVFPPLILCFIPGTNLIGVVLIPALILFGLYVAFWYYCIYPEKLKFNKSTLNPIIDVLVDNSFQYIHDCLPNKPILDILEDTSELDIMETVPDKVMQLKHRESILKWKIRKNLFVYYRGSHFYKINYSNLYFQYCPICYWYHDIEDCQNCPTISKNSQTSYEKIILTIYDYKANSKMIDEVLIDACQEHIDYLIRHYKNNIEDGIYDKDELILE